MTELETDQPDEILARHLTKAHVGNHVGFTYRSRYTKPAFIIDQLVDVWVAKNLSYVKIKTATVIPRASAKHERYYWFLDPNQIVTIIHPDSVPPDGMDDKEFDPEQ